ncbi:histidine kinase dimerization/phospho-acceptor domain-containing protein [Halalkalibacter akibai]|uniref:histidine kinase n=1 Tax=Halalkalibacter akibai (strain ATCC 43226 / DSM 21942 / CIP 109018 / JCM 9157 / 1139) TaxID=1236973 RepID=W4QNK5_HALA3|nr:histidine kinase dimerization/phospho-acceptor domain-containing protein [Halalkalibacter akibai]GAE33700.1 sensor histidine kinase [Halalkalibacter akibai JCM 9157]
MTETLLINFLFLLLPVLIYLLFFESRAAAAESKLVVFLLSTLSMILCMTFPIQIAHLGFLFDLRYVPFIIAALFTGYKVAFPLYIVLNIYRFIIGGDGVFMSFLVSTIIFILVPLGHKYFIKQTSNKRVVFAGFVSFLVMLLFLTTLSMFFPTLNRDYWLIAVNVVTIHVLGAIIIMVFIEKIIANAKNREAFAHSDRLHVISELSASVSHEIRNPLTVTNGFLQLLGKSERLEEQEKRYIDLSLKELNRAEQIVSDFLALAKPQAHNMVRSNLNKKQNM